MGAPFSFPHLLLAEVELLLAGIAVDPMGHQGVRTIEDVLDSAMAMALLALGDIALGEAQVF